MSFLFVIEVLGTAAFAISGAFSAMQKKLDLFGVLSLAFVTAIGGGTIRDVLIGNTPVTWMRDMTTPITILAATLIALAFNRLLKNLKYTLFLADTVGIGLFTVIGIQKGISVGLHPGICVALGTMTACFGGVVRDVLLNQIPALFHTREIYATACIAGGTAYFVCDSFIPDQPADIIAIVVIVAIRLIAVRMNWQLPAVKE
ncbi:trimeric intracellular cation channel family protein [Mucilaginibacter myungsuensis]|uniref:Trimeric intracellular cation channel family protein n=1 Tax=Mucilaginibacter myungsuensis TaxID=649104 RepID=A0A929L246_9SPHI|nr:trimeric intracellular cation channel family protein [Mucilaginibacter myungsuensis]MBE9664223.1 trimeric intracellular cation channel family protein [Mucilaginibacter myungsuensis]MDN3599927.1 trimeric intracellular cation channel family protein [Mucilaginibacter myungsuensis]